MKRCDTCGREFLDSYEECPLCAQERFEARIDAATTQMRDERQRRGVRWWFQVGAGGILAVCAIWLVWVWAFGNFIGRPALDHAVTSQCYAIQVEYERAVMLWMVSNGAPPQTLEQAAADQGVTRTCPAGGAYTLSYEREQPRIACSVHGSRSEAR